MFIEWLGEISYTKKCISNISNRFISNLKWDYIYVLIQIDTIYVGFFVKYYIINHIDIMYIWGEIRDYVASEYEEYINNNITTMIQYKCEHCLFNNHYPVNIEDDISAMDIECSECNTRIDNKFIRDYENNYYHIHCFNKNPNIFKNNKSILTQCKMCCKYINLHDHSLRCRHLSNKYDIFKYIQNCELEQSCVYMDDDNIYTLLFTTSGSVI